MTQNFPDIYGSDFIDVGIKKVQDRDNATLTFFTGSNQPSDKIWNDIKNQQLKYNDKIIIDYGNPPIHKDFLEKYQPLNSNLTNFSGSVNANTILTANGHQIAISEYFINDFSKNGITLGKLSKENKVVFGNKSVTTDLVDSSIRTTPVFMVGDIVMSLNRGTKQGFVKLSRDITSIYTIGGTSSGATYKGSVYQNLFNRLWEINGTDIYTSTGNLSSRGTTALADWNSNKRIALPFPKYPGADKPEEPDVFQEKTSGSYNINLPEGIYLVTVIGAGGGAGGGSYGDGHKSSGDGAGSGSGFIGYLTLNGDYTITVGKGGNGGGNGRKGGYNGTNGGDSSISNLVIAGGGEGGRGHKSSGVSGRGGTLSLNVTPFETILATNGNTCSGSTGGSSVYQSYGTGGNGVYKESGKSGNDGYVSIEYKAPTIYNSIDDDFIEDVNTLMKELTFFMKY